MKKMQDWKKEFARDLIALGGIPFYLIAVIRMLIYPEFAVIVPRLVIAFIAVMILAKFIEYNKHIALAFILVAFTSIGYKENLYTVFASLLWVLMIFSLVHLGEKRERIIKGVISGIISALAGYYIAFLLGFR